MKSIGKKLMLAGLALLVFAISACTANDRARENANKASRDYAPYTVKNFIDQRNYSWRLEMTDDPSMILWCTIFPTTPGVKPMTLPIMGKLTSSGKRPFSGDSTLQVDDQAMYGSSDPYRYGFGPTGKAEYYDISASMDMLCTSQPLVWQSQLTILVQSKDNTLLIASQQARDLIAAGRGEEAQAVLDAAMQAAQGGQ